jgi:hypothetical protein
MTNHDPNIAMQQFIGAGVDIVRAAFVENADANARARAARVCRLILQLLEGQPAVEPEVREVAPPYQPRPPASFGEYAAHAMGNPQELQAILGPLLAALGPAAPMALSMLRNAFLRPAPPAYVGR